MTGTFQKRLAVAGVALLCLVLGWNFRENSLRRQSLTRRSESTPLPSPSTSATAHGPGPGRSPVTAGQTWVAILPVPAGTPQAFSDARATNRLRNTSESAGRLVHNPHAILLRNAFVDTTNSVALAVPSPLHATAHPGAYVVQVREDRATDISGIISDAGGRVVSYIPNRSWLVVGDEAVAHQLAASPEVAAILPYEPYFKLEPALIPVALQQSAPVGNLRLVLTLPEARQITGPISALGARELHRERGPFGTLLTVDAPAASLVALAQLPEVQLIESWTPARPANDRSGILLGVNTNADNTGSYLGLTGKGVLVNINDTGIDATHVDLVGRVLTVPGATNSFGVDLLTDPDGHGTHVAATLAGSGAGSGTLAALPQGSVSNANFQGKAPGATLFILPSDISGGPSQGDEYLQTTAASSTNRTNLSEPLISNNSWVYPRHDYSSQSASYDAAVRDALPDMTGDQPILYVFAAGNDGGGGDNGQGGIPDTITSPGNAKNVITVGALESARNLTNSVIQDTNGTFLVIGSSVFGTIDTNRYDYITNTPFAAMTDTDIEVAGYSSRGNVGVGTEGDFGRLKPDVLAPGSFVISARSSLWQLTNEIPTNNTAYYYLFNDLTRETAPNYRYEFGTSMATPAISGLLALMQEFFHQPTNGPSPSAAGYKALLINGASATSEAYAPDSASALNLSGWGEPYLPRILQPGASFVGATGRVAYVIESDDTSVPLAPGETVRRQGLATGEARSFRLALTDVSAAGPVRLTLVWTDPPGNPVGAAKLVNDLDLMVSNVTTGEIFVGNRFDPGTGLSSALIATNEFRTNAEAIFDRINNVERIVFDPAGATNFVVSVVGHLVNVNARRDATSEILQDFALAISSDGDSVNGVNTATLATIANPPVLPGTGSPALVPFTNSFPLPYQRVGENSPLIGGETGEATQWRFYILTNFPGMTVTNGDMVLTNGKYVFFQTIATGELSRSRTNGPDIDVYVSKDPALTNLDATVIAQAYKSTTQGGDEQVLFTESAPGQSVYYVGVKSEDHEAAEYTVVGGSSAQPFTSLVNGVPTPLAIPLFPVIPDGTPKKPGKGLYMAISNQARKLRKVIATTVVRHQRFPDLLGNLKHNNHYAVLNNHGLLGGLLSQTNPGVKTVYEDTRSTKYGKTRHTDGPGSLLNFLGEPSTGSWLLSMVDNAAGNTGRIAGFTLGLVPNDFGDEYVTRCVDPYSDEVEFIEIPPDGIALEVTVTNMNPVLPLEVYIKRDDLPDPAAPTNSDKYATIQPPGGTLSLTTHDVPPLVAGRYFVLVHNPNGVQVCYRIRGHVVRNLDSVLTRVYSYSGPPVSLPDQARTISSISIAENRPVTALSVGLRIDHPRESDLAVRLTDPAGVSTVLVENRGGTTSTGFGSTAHYTNGAFSHVALTFQRSSHQALIYVNGQLVGQKTLPRYSPVTTNALYFRLDPTGQLGSTNAPLIVDDFGLWGTVMPLELVQDIYVDGLLGFSKDPSDVYLGLQAHWTFDVDGTDSLGTNTVVLSGGTRSVAAQVGNGILFESPDAFGRAESSPTLDVGSLPGFTLEGWINSGSVPEFIAGWGETNVPPRPALLANFASPLGSGLGSVSALLSGYDTNGPGSAVVVYSPAGLNEPNSVTTETQFAAFNDDTETANQYIKFAVPPFLSSSLSSPLVVSEFEIDPPGVFTTGQVLDGWSVEGQVTQLYTPGDAYNGQGFISLDELGIHQSLNVVSNEFYSFSFAAKRSLDNTNGASQLLVMAGTNQVGVLDLDVVWQTNVFHYFSSNTGPIQVSFEPSSDYTGTNAGVWLDSVVLSDGGAGHYLPEEPLKPHIGAVATGNWSLELADTRGPVTGSLINWQLTLTLAPTNPAAVRLVSGSPYVTNVAGDGTQYFIVEVPPEAFSVTNTLISVSGGPLRLLFNQNGLPDGSLANDSILLDNVTGSGFRIIDKTGLPVLKPGQRYYLGVQNINLTESNVFSLQIDFGIPITPLVDGIPLSATNLDVGLVDYYSFDVSPNVLAARFSLSNFPSDLNLVLSKGQPLPTKSSSQYASTNSDTTPEVIVVDLTDQPVPISAGRWYLGVYATGVAAPTPVPYTIVASQITNATVLTSGVPLADAVTNSIRYYSVAVPDTAILLQFALQNLSGPADLYVRYGDIPLPGLGRFDASSIASGTDDRVVQINSNSVPVALAGGIWYVAVVPQGSGPVTYTLTALASTGEGGYTDLLDSVPTYSSLTVDHVSDLYRFMAPTNTSGLLFEIYNLTGEAHLYAASGVFPALSPNPLTNFQSAGSPELIVIRTNSVTNDLVGTYFLEVRSPGMTDLSYTVRASTEKNGLLNSGQDSVAALGDVGTDGLPTTLTINTVPGELYELQVVDALTIDPAGSQWLPVPPPVVATGVTLKLPLPSPSGTAGNVVFYRVVHLPHP